MRGKAYVLRKTVFLLFAILMFSLGVFAEENNTGDKESTLLDRMFSLSEESGQLSPDDVQNLGQQAADALSPESIWNFGIDRLGEALKNSFAVFPLLLAVILLSSVIGIFSENLGSGTRLLELACLLGVISIVFGAVKPVIEQTDAFLEKYVSFMTAANASASLLLSSCGEVSAAAVSASSSAFVVGLMQILSHSVVLPCVKIVLAFGVLSTLSKTLDLSGVINFIRNFCTWGLGVLFAVFGGIHAAAVRTAAGADNAAVRGIRFTAARLVPSAGNMLSECFRTVLGAANVIKGTFGALGIAYLLYLVIPTLCTVLAVKFSVLFALFCSKLMGTRPFTGFLESVGSSLNILIAICLFASVSGIILFAACTETALSV